MGIQRHIGQMSCNYRKGAWGADLQAKELLGPPEAGRGKEPLLEAPERLWPCWDFDVKLLASRTGRECVPVGLSNRVCGIVTAAPRNQDTMGPGLPHFWHQPSPPTKVPCRSPCPPKSHHPQGKQGIPEHLPLTLQPCQKPPSGLFKEAHGHRCVIPLPQF